MALGRYFVVDAVAKRILSGPLVLDSTAVATWPLPPGGTLIVEAAALAGGYTFPAAPVDPADVLRGKAAQALTVNAAFLALSSPSNPQVVTQVQRLTRETNALIRLLLQQLDDTSDT